MKKKNRMFNLLKEDVQERCIETDRLVYDRSRTVFVKKYHEDKRYNVIVISPIIKLPPTKKNMNDCYIFEPGLISDDGDSYTILYKFIRNKDGIHSEYDIIIMNYCDENILYHKITCIEDIGEPCTYPVYFISDAECFNDIEKIRKGLSKSVAIAVNLDR